MPTLTDFTLQETLDECELWSMYRGRKHRSQKTHLLLSFQEDHYPVSAIQEFRYLLESTSGAHGEILRAQEYFDADGHFVVVFEDWPGTMLAEVLKRRRIRIDEFFIFARNLITALGALHGHGPVHAALTPHSILLDESGEVKILPFMCPRELVGRSRLLHHPEFIEKLLPYLSPEQTGGSGRQTDHRSDQYSLGAVLYRVLTGITPFQSEDPLELVYSHAMRTPIHPIALRRDIPSMLSLIVMKLLEKDPENRYQGTPGLITDLDRCNTLFEKGTPEATFALGEGDIPELFSISGKLYGRRKEAETAALVFDGIRRGGKEIINITGPSGIGKTTFVQSVIRPFAGIRGLYIAGKCDQLSSATPYAPMIEAFRGLIRQILSEGDEVVEIWRETILDAVGVNGRVITDVIPEVELITGAQPMVPELGAKEAKNRFNLVFTRFVRVFASRHRPLTIFIDDLQWVDPATVLLFKYIMADPTIHNLLLIAAYRDNEIGEYHSIQAVHREIEKSGIPMRTLGLNPLDVVEVTELITDTLRCREEKAWQLAALAYQHTGGNPLLVVQFLKSLYEEKHLVRETSGWTWDIETIRKMYETDSIITVMANRIKALPENALRILKHASCIGNKFDIETLIHAFGETPTGIIDDIRILMEHGYVAGHGTQYRFSHDRYYETAYHLIPENTRFRIHERIGTALLREYGQSGDLQEKIFGVVNQFNMASPLITGRDERRALSDLNMKAGRKARLSIAYQSAARYYRLGQALLDEDAWKNDYALAMEIYRGLFECEYFIGNNVEADRLFELIVKNSRTAMEKAQIHDLKVILLMNSSRPADAIRIGLDGLRLLGVRLDPAPSRPRLIWEMGKLWLYFRRHGIESVLSLPAMNDDVQAIVMSLLVNMWTPAYASNHGLMQLIPMTMVNTSLRHGNCNYSALGYAMFGMMLTSGFGDFASGYRFGMVSRELGSRYLSDGLECALSFMLGAYLIHWKEHARNEIAYLRKAHVCGVAAGELYFSRLTGIFHAGTMAMEGDGLEEVLKTAGEYLDYITRGKNHHVRLALLAVIRTALQLQGRTVDALDLGDATFNEREFLGELMNTEVIQPLHWYCVFKSRNLYIFGYFHEALDLLEKYGETREWHFSTMILAEHLFVHSLTVAALHDDSTKNRHRHIMRTLRRNQRIMRRWAENAPENFLHKYLLVEAEINRINGDEREAVSLYNKAIGSAVANGYRQNAAIGNELAAKFHLSRGLISYARIHLAAARDAYNEWGASAKVRMIDERYWDILSGTPGRDGHDTPEKAITDAASDELRVLSEFHRELAAISSASDPERLASMVTQLALRGTGARRAVLYLSEGGNPRAIHAATAGASVSIEGDDSAARETATLVIGQAEPKIVWERRESSVGTIDRSHNDELPVSAICVPVPAGDVNAGALYCDFDPGTHVLAPSALEVLTIIGTGAGRALERMKGASALDRPAALRSQLKNVDTEALSARLTEMMETRKAYKTEDLTLMMVAEELSVSPHQLSEFINNRLGMNFNTYVNRYRVEEAMRILVDDPDKPITAIAFDLGFNSISVFYNAFLKNTGISPARYRRENRKIPGIIVPCPPL